MRVASNRGNIPSKFGHARPLRSRIIRYVRDGRTDGRTKATLNALLPYGRDITSKTNHMHMFTGAVGGMCKVEWLVVTLLVGDNVGQSLGMNSSFGK